MNYPRRVQHLFKGSCRNRPAEIVALNLVTVVGFEERKLFLAFDAFSDHRHLQTMRHADDGLDDGGIVFVMGDVPHKGLIDLERIDRESL